MAIPKQALGVLLTLAYFRCFPMITDARAVAENEKQLEPGEYASQQIVPPVFPTHFISRLPSHEDNNIVIVNPDPLGTIDPIPVTIPPSTLTNDGQRNWCIVKASSDDIQFHRNVEFCCKQAYQHPKYNCTMIQPGGPCYRPNNSVSDASVVMNLYYQGQGKQPHNCYFNGSGIFVNDDPSTGSCIYPIF